MTLTSNAVTFSLDGFPTHKKVYVRLMAYTECTTQDKTIKITLTGTPAVSKNITLVTNT